jgi:elongation factor P--(R)-beta-lysine ligase
MDNNLIALLEDKKARLKLRAGLFSAIRDFFNSRGFLEIDTPIMIDAPAPEEFIEAPPAGDKFLRTSPELQLKQLLAAGYEKIYEIGPCFRLGEHGRRHREEFTMLEWYEAGQSSDYLINFTAEMLRFTAPAPIINNIDFNAEPYIITVDEAYQTFCGKSPDDALRDGDFDELMVTKIEPKLGLARPTFLSGYPAERAALAKLGPNGRARRWELYLGGLEIANAYSELTDPTEQRRRFAAATIERMKAGGAKYPEPEKFYQALDHGIPKSTGCALGLDRLMMIFSNSSNICNVRLNNS